MPTEAEWLALPELTTLAALGHKNRRVAVQAKPGVWEWCGDLSLKREQRIYQIMLWTRGSLVQSTPSATGGRMLFARISERFDPESAYQDALRIVFAELGITPRRRR